MKKFYCIAMTAMLVALNGFANSDINEANIKRYESARVAIKYKGKVGDFTQKLAAELNIPFYILQANPSIEINVRQDNTKSIKELFNNINQQLKSENIRFDIVNDKLTLVLLSNTITELNNPDYIGEIVFDSDPIKPAKEIEFSPEDKKQLEQQKANENSNTLSQEAQQSEQPQSQQVDANQNVASVEKTEISEERKKIIEEEAKKIEAILKVSQDKNLINQYYRRPQPNYVISDSDKKAIKLNTIKSTKISTFLVFDDGVNLSNYKFDGQFQDFAKLANVAAILHRQQRPPQTITITSPEGKQVKLTLSN